MKNSKNKSKIFLYSAGYVKQNWTKISNRKIQIYIAEQNRRSNKLYLIILIDFDWFVNCYRNQDKSNTNQTSIEQQSKIIERQTTFELNQNLLAFLLFDWFSITFGNRTSIVQFSSIVPQSNFWIDIARYIVQSHPITSLPAQRQESSPTFVYICYGSI